MPDELESLWESEQRSVKHDGALTGTNNDADVVVVGAGITGLTAALLLQQSGKRTILLERAHVGAGVTGRTTAHITSLPDASYADLASDFGRETARLVARGLSLAIDRIEALVRDHAIECGFARVPAWHYAEPGQSEEEIAREIEAARDAGLEVVEDDAPPLPPTFEIAKGLRIERQARFHPTHYLEGLARAYRAAGGRLHLDSRVTKIAEGEPCVVTAQNGATVRATDVVLGTHTPLGVRMHHTALEVYRSYALAMHLGTEPPDGLFFDNDDPYRYLRKQETEHGIVWTVGGGDHRVGKGDPQQALRALERWARERFDVTRVLFGWSAQVYDPADGLPYIGPTLRSKHVWMGTGYAGDGMTFGTLAAELIAAMIDGARPELAAPYKPTRFKPPVGAKGLIEDGVETARNLIFDRIRHPDAGKLDEITPGDARVVRMGTHQLAVYRDEAGALHASSAVCPHMKCMVHWNGAEKSWDCSCHGSRFDVDGKYIEGPSLGDLAPVEIEHDAAKRAS